MLALNAIQFNQPHNLTVYALPSHEQLIPDVILTTRNTNAVSMAPERLTQVVENLLENALSFASTEVRIELSRTHGYGVISFEDDGPGIPNQHMEKIRKENIEYQTMFRMIKTKLAKERNIVL